MKLRRVGVLSAFRVGFMFYGILGLLVGGLAFLGSVLGGAAGGGLAAGFGGGLVVLIVAPLLYGLAGALVFMIMAFLYNVVASLVGGLELELDGLESSTFR